MPTVKIIIRISAWFSADSSQTIDVRRCGFGVGVGEARAFRTSVASAGSLMLASWNTLPLAFSLHFVRQNRHDN